jgi:hypothetical protein
VPRDHLQLLRECGLVFIAFEFAGFLAEAVDLPN